MGEFYELTYEYYLNCSSNCSKELAEIRETSFNLDDEYLSKNDEILELKAQIKNIKKEKRIIAKEITQNEKYLEVDIRFLEDLNRGMSNRGGKNFVDYQKRKAKIK